MDEKDNDAIMIGGDEEEEDSEIPGLEEDSERGAEEDKAETAKDGKKPTERPSLKEKLELMKGKAAKLSAERKEVEPHVEKEGNFSLFTVKHMFDAL